MALSIGVSDLFFFPYESDNQALDRSDFKVSLAFFGLLDSIPGSSIRPSQTTKLLTVVISKS